nr:MAG TPA: restriction endonuclease [Crassvirales sp.]
MENVQTKVCPGCGRDLPSSDYSKGSGKFGRRRLGRLERRNNEVGYREREKQVDLLRIINNSDSYKKSLIRVARRRATVENLPFNIDCTDIGIPEYCPLLGIELNKHVGEGEAKFDSPTIDKLIPSLGYTKGNVWVISRRANMIKSDATLEELELLVGNLKTHWIH